jgi:hypothetical protein
MVLGVVAGFHPDLQCLAAGRKEAAQGGPRIKVVLSPGEPTVPPSPKSFPGHPDSSVMGSEAESGCMVGCFLRGAKMLFGHAAVLFVGTIVGMTTAQIQISTRLVLPTSPMLYWYLASVVSKITTNTDAHRLEKDRSLRHSPLSRQQIKKPAVLQMIKPLFQQECYSVP